MSLAAAQGAAFLMSIAAFWVFLHARGRHHAAPANATIERLQRELKASQAREYRLQTRLDRSAEQCEAMVVAAPPPPPPPPPMRCVKRAKRLCMRSVMEAVEAQRLPVITSNQAAALARELNRKLGL